MHILKTYKRFSYVFVLNFKKYPTLSRDINDPTRLKVIVNDHDKALFKCSTNFYHHLYNFYAILQWYW